MGMSLRMLGWGLLVGVVCGCDSRPTPPTPPPPTQPSAPAAPARPTTQQLTEGPYKTISLPEMPLTMKVPESWSIDSPSTTTGGIKFLVGPTPSGQVTINLAQHGAVKKDQLQMLITRGKDEQQKKPDSIKRYEVRDVGELKLIERLSYEPPRTVDELGPSGQNVRTTFVPVRWNVIAMVPYQDSYTRYELNFMDLTADQFSKDQAFLERIVSSLAAEGSTPVSAPATTEAK